MAFFKFFAERHLLACIISLIFILLGSSTLVTIQRDAFPSVEFGELLITTTYPGASPEDVELMVTNEIEKEIKEVTGIERYNSWSRENISTIHLVIDPNTSDEEKVIRDIREAVSRVTNLPPEVTQSPLVTELGTSSFPMIEVGLSGKQSYSDLRTLASRLERRLKNIEGISKTERYGYRAREVRIEIDANKLKKAEISLAEVVQAIGQRNVRATGGSFESYTSEKNIVTLAQFCSPEEVGDVIVRTTFDGPSIKVRDLARINDAFEEEKVLSRVNGESAISFVAFKAENTDVIRTVAAIKKMVKHEQSLMPPSVKIVLSNDISKSVKDKFSIVANNGLIGLALVMLVLTIFLSLRLAFWVALGIPVALLGTTFMLPVFGSFLDSITMTAMVLVLGIIVDDAIIIAESIHQQYEKGLTAVEAAVTGVQAVIKPVITTILTTFAVFLPMFFMPGMLGKFVIVIPLVITLALIVSLIESTLALPAHIAASMPPHNGPSKRQQIFDKLRNSFARLLQKVLVARYLLILLFLSSLLGSSLKATSDRASKVESLVTALGKTELDSFVTRIGTFGDIGSSQLENNAAIFVTLSPYANRERSADEIVEGLRTQTDLQKDKARVFYQIDTGGPPVGRPISLKIVGADDRLRTRLADDIVAHLKTLGGTKDIDRDDKTGKSQVEIKNAREVRRLLWLPETCSTQTEAYFLGITHKPRSISHLPSSKSGSLPSPLSAA